MQAVSIRVPQAFFASYRRACTEFVWGKSHPRLSFERLTLPKLKGGIDFPDIVKYHWACQLARIIDWNIHSHSKAWIHIEHAFSPLPLLQLSWIAAMHTTPECKLHPLIGNTEKHAINSKYPPHQAR